MNQKKYPTLEEAETADKFQLARWMRFLGSPGECAAGRDNFSEVCEEQLRILDVIIRRFQEMGGWDSQLSKKVGW